MEVACLFMGCAGNNRAKRGGGERKENKCWVCRKKMEQETRYHHMFGYIQTATPRGTMMMVGGEVVVEREDETREVVGRVGTKYREVVGPVVLSLLSLGGDRYPLFLVTLDS